MDIIQADKSVQPLSAGLYAELQSDILSGAIPNSSKLTEQAICKKYNISRTPVREAFRQLEADGLIENIPNRGAFVAGTGNRMIQKTLAIYQTYLKHSAPAKTYTGDYLKTILEEHKAIFEAFESKNPAAGRKAMEYHMAQSKLRRISNYF